jgi:hypothetical protein
MSRELRLSSMDPQVDQQVKLSSTVNVIMFVFSGSFRQ